MASWEAALLEDAQKGEMADATDDADEYREISEDESDSQKTPSSQSDVVENSDSKWWWVAVLREAVEAVTGFVSLLAQRYPDLQAAWVDALELDAGVEESAVDEDAPSHLHDDQDVDMDRFAEWLSDSANEAPDSDLGLTSASEPDSAAGLRQETRGRPRGTRGSADLRRYIQEHMSEAPAEPAATEPLPGSIEYARAARQNLAMQRRAAREQVKSREESLEVAMETAVGSSVQRTLATAWLKVRGRGTATTDEDPAANVVLGQVASAASARIVSKLMNDVPGSVLNMLLQCGAAVFAMGCWMWSVLVTYFQLWKKVPHLRVVLLVLKLKYDETPMRVRVGASSDGQHRLLSRRDPQEAATAAKIMQAHFRGQGNKKRVLVKKTQGSGVEQAVQWRLMAAIRNGAPHRTEHEGAAPRLQD
ncbi:hypothetical protein AK812_SmicGene21181 [Symbiodinium microadriaticum]|uniref:Uncharacterized protein n=1 Tax=Symbiodinium microadriaticum TaxID=2951 RepID=A0A1Q9DN35_SYMMI|nr:hypothetical protein AK812_SmicGene21181 [Symbiodinium microadriaticum]